jgi:hypothetical protein
MLKHSLCKQDKKNIESVACERVKNYVAWENHTK